MEVFINNQVKQLTQKTSLQGLLLEFGFEEVRGIAVAVNEQVVPKPQWSSYFLGDKDSIIIIKATQGGQKQRIAYEKRKNSNWEHD